MPSPADLVALGLLLCFLVLVVGPDGTHGSSRGSFGPNNGAAAPVSNGICATSVTIHGYKCQEHEVNTEDGYILNMQRIPEGRVGWSSGGGNKKQPVLIQHGVLVDGMTWLLNSPEQNLPMILADNGFDVWIANTRGTRFCRHHVSLDPLHPKFWDWSWDELVTYDLPAVFGFVFNQTGQKIHYIGHSLGTLIGLASFSEGHQADKLKSAAFLSPIAYLSHMKTALGVLAARAFVGEITTLFGIAEFNPKGHEASGFLKALCGYPGVNCYDLVSAITGKNCCLNASMVDIFLKNEPQSTATKNMVHLAQTVRDGVIKKYDHGRPDYNLMHYGQPRPPAYNISNIARDLPVFICYGGEDALSDVLDVQQLLDHLKFHDVNKLSVQYIKDYAHADFIMGINAKDVVYNQVVQFFKNQQ
ncbi:Triacylglycerol lipase 2 [Hibiscus syriacus]|uniref:Lipase n=1 Tax=Hibiscus syriacus TaxID=106335 RepID=A0A6A3A0H1_HIBSY|nr:triacylglycerol lipase 2-like [Hibiscus syriacus]KAE8697097.1 Triacylglycerol lipase 2 [Hibiscus syriacus]